MQGSCTTLGGLCILDAKQQGRILYGSGPWVRLTLVNVRLVNGNSRDACELVITDSFFPGCTLVSSNARDACELQGVPGQLELGRPG